jgi:hypothetical protein
MRETDLRPRRLRLLRIEDEIKPWSKPQLLEDLQQIAEWRPFFESLVRVDRVDGTSGTPPDILAVDFGFQGDGTLPKVPDERHEHVELFGQELADRFRWSSRLGQPNTGLIIATAVLGQWAGRDLPMVIALHSAATKEVLADMSSALLAAQLMALGRTWSASPSSRHPLVDLHDILEHNRLPKVAETAVMRIMPAYRRILLERTGSIASGSAVRPRLFVDPIAIARLQQLLGAGGTADVIAPELDSCGIEVVDLHGTHDVLDLRSVFCDCEIRTWLTEPPESPTLDTALKEPAAFVAFLRRTTEGAYREAASIVQNNKDSSRPQMRIGEGKDWPKYLALAFALVEDAIIQHERMNAPWDLLEDGGTRDLSAPSLGEHCVFIATEWHRWCQERLETSGDAAGFTKHLRRKIGDIQMPAAQWLGARSAGDQLSCVETILARLTRNEVFAEVGKEPGTSYRLKCAADLPGDDDDDCQLIREAVRTGLSKGELSPYVRVAGLLGLQPGKKDYSKQLHRIEAFGEDDATKRIRLMKPFQDLGSAPAFVMAPIRWYLSEYHAGKVLPQILAGFTT